MRLKVGSDPFRVWIEDEDTTLDDPDHIRLHFRIDDTGPNGMSKKLKRRLSGDRGDDGGCGEPRARELMTVAALYVATDGCYFGLDGVDPWDETRDAREYAGPHPVVAHPPCARWGRYWFGGPTWVAKGNPPKKLGDDEGCFAAAIEAVRKWGGVIEHPADTYAWKHFGIPRPDKLGGWRNDWFDRRIFLPCRARALWPPRPQGDMALRRGVPAVSAGVGQERCEGTP